MARKSNLAKGKSRTKKITAGPNKGDTVTFKGSPSGKPYPSRVVRDVGSRSTLSVAKKKAKKKKSRR